MALLGLAISGLSGFFRAAGIYVLFVAIAALIRGHVDWARLRGRTAAGVALAASIVSLAVGGATANPTPETPIPPVAQTVTATVTETVTETVAETVTVPGPTVTQTVTVKAPAPKPAATATKKATAPAPLKSSAPKPAYTPPKPASVYYANCDAARAAGAAPLYRGEPGYRSGLDRDGDGVACE